MRMFRNNTAYNFLDYWNLIFWWELVNLIDWLQHLPKSFAEHQPGRPQMVRSGLWKCWSLAKDIQMPSVFTWELLQQKMAWSRVISSFSLSLPRSCFNVLLSDESRLEFLCMESRGNVITTNCKHRRREGDG